MPPKKPPADPQSCIACKFFLMAAKGALVGECRRYPPTPVSDEGVAVCVCPQMGVSDWCGEYQWLTH